jgi:hypothetical protein
LASGGGLTFKRKSKQGKAAFDRWQEESFQDFLSGQAKVDSFSASAVELVRARNEAARRAIVARSPELAGERGAAALEAYSMFATTAGLVGPLRELQDLQAWQRRLRGGDASPERAGSPPPMESVPDILRAFVAGAVNADQQFLRTQDLAEVGRGIEVWERLDGDGVLAGTDPADRVDPQLMAAMLYGRRYEVKHADADLDTAFRLLSDAARHVAPGSHNDILIRMSSATWFMLRYEAHDDQADLERAITGYEGIREVAPAGDASRALATANLGRAFLVRHEISRDDRDLVRGGQLLNEAYLALPEGHPVRSSIQSQAAMANLRAAAKR